MNDRYTRYASRFYSALLLVLVLFGSENLLAQTPNVQLTSYNWGERWVTNECSKSEAGGYGATILLSNGDGATIQFRNIWVSGADNAAFNLNASDVARLNGKLVRELDQHDLHVTFRPSEVRSFSATVEVVYEWGQGNIDTARCILEGAGIESYIQVSDCDFGSVRLVAGEHPVVPGTVYISAPESATRPVTVYGITLSDNNHFRIAPTWAALNADWHSPGSKPRLLPGEVVAVDLEFLPDADLPALQQTTLDVIGDFAYAECSGSDSSGLLYGVVETVSIEADGIDFGTLLTCFEVEDSIVVRNTGSLPLSITNISQPMPAQSGFIVDESDIAYPVVLEPAGDPNGADEIRIPVRYRPTGVGAAQAFVTIYCSNGDSEFELQVPLTAVAETVTGSASIREDYFVPVGSEIVVPVRLDDDPAQAEITEFIINIEFDEDAVSLTGGDNIEPGSLLPIEDGWGMELISRRPGSMTVRLYSTGGRVLAGTGEILLLRFRALGIVNETDVSFNITPVAFGQNSSPCIEFATIPGHIRIGSPGDCTDCADQQAAVMYVMPQPIIDEATIYIILNEPGIAAVELYSPDGRRVAVVREPELLDAGLYPIQWTVPIDIEGPYYLYLTVGDKRFSRSIVIW